MKNLNRPIDIASLVFFRMAFGLILFWEVLRYFMFGWIGSHYIVPQFFFKYYGFEWVQPFPSAGMYLFFAFLGLLALMLAAGLFYRVTSVLFFLAFTYLFLLDQTHYLNHFYFVSLLSFLLIWLPCERAFSLDALRKPAIQSDTVPAWTLGILRFQIGLVYFYAGVAKLNSDWLAGEPVRMWLSWRSNMPVIGPFLTEEWVISLFAYGGAVFDLTIPFFLLWDRTRLVAFLAALFFHLTNAFVFNIGIFPWLMIAATLLFFPPESFRFWERSEMRDSKLFNPSFALKGALTVFVALQILVPLRHFLYPGSVHWTEEGHRFSWHMKLRSKDARSVFLVRNPQTRESRRVYPYVHLTPKQVRKMSARPDMILQYAHYLAKLNGGDVEVYGYVEASLNHHPPGLLIDPQVDLAKEKRNLWHAGWITENPPEVD